MHTYLKHTHTHIFIHTLAHMHACMFCGERHISSLIGMLIAHAHIHATHIFIDTLAHMHACMHVLQ